MKSDRSNIADIADHETVAELKSEIWQRVSPAAVIFYVVKFVGGILRNGIQALAPVVAVVATAGENRWYILVAFAAIGGVTMIVGALLSYLNFKFRLEESSFLIRSGVLKRKRLTLSFDRIQNVALSEPLYFRPLGLVILTLESAGSKSEEVNLAGIPRPLANVIRRHVLDWKSQKQDVVKEGDKAALESAADTTEIGTTDLLHQPVSELAKYGLSNNNIFVFAGISAVLFSQIDKFWKSPIVAEIFGVVGETVGTGSTAIAAFIIFSILTILLLLTAASVVGAIVANYNYHLSHRDQKYHVSRGLFNRQETSVPEVKIQSFRISQPFIARLLNRFHLTLQQVGFESSTGGSNKQSFMIPSVSKKFYLDLATRLFPTSTVMAMPLVPISKRYVVRHSLYTAGFALPAAVFIWAFTYSWVAALPLLVPLVSLPIFILRRHRYGYASSDTHGVVRSGFLGQNLTLFPFHKVQTVEIVQSPSQRKHNLADLKIKMAGRTLTVPYVSLADAVNWRNAALLEVETNHKPWM